MAAAQVGPMRPLWAIRSADGSPMAEPPRFALARDAVRHVGEPVCAVVAATEAEALEAAEQVRVEYDPLPALVDVEAAIAPGASQLHAAAPGNVCFRWVRGDADALRGAFQSAAHVVSVELINNRLVGGAIEPRAALALPATGGAKLTLYSSTQVPHHIRRMVAEQLGLAESDMRVVAPDVGGGFGYKGKLYPEESIVVFAARELARPVRWVATRSESFTADNQNATT
jgi:carbon-monoxide dehydrogenase large subunit